jgi:hypothetical protein
VETTRSGSIQGILIELIFLAVLVWCCVGVFKRNDESSSLFFVSAVKPIASHLLGLLVMSAIGDVLLELLVKQ